MEDEQEIKAEEEVKAEPQAETEPQVEEVEEKIEDVKKALSDALLQNAVLKQENERLQKERDEANSMFLKSEKESEEENKRDITSLLGDLQ